ncbi:MAG: glutamate--tRNA ligase [Candidatus Paralactobacillus gallistercoris]|uniref:Glutamate--tRNA ligase n=1 Tax=Candidatus Paralactobacillus gallistercoris TaxID=2838724 RepID=A0A948X1E4_9LACO|nr:glutamate--tRNA ligase [Candidatus Paralactobacillus gallistercoris]
MENKKIRVRYAPSPTGHLHIGNARTALFNYLFARHTGGTFVIRIEDTDIKRNVADGERSQLENLKWLGIDWDEGPDKPGKYGPYRQTERLDIYRKYVQELLDKGIAYESFKTEEELEAEREEQKARGEMPHYIYEYEGMTDEEKAQKIAAAKAKGLKPAIRIHVPKNHNYEWDDMVKGHVCINSDSLSGDWIIEKANGIPTYNFCVVIDDHLMEISHVLRGDDHVANTPKQLMIYDAFGWERPIFGHMTLIVKAETGRKLSKRDETTLQFIEQYRELGYLPEAMFNFITLLGWSPKGTNEILSRKEAIKEFDPSRLSRSPARFDKSKLEWVNNQYIKKTDPSEITALSLHNLIKAGRIQADPDAKTIEWARQLISLYTDNMSYTQQIVELSTLFFEEPADLNDDERKELADPSARIVLEEFAQRAKTMPVFTAFAIKNAINDVHKVTKVRGRKLYMPIRIATTREMHGPQLPETLELMGRDKALANLADTLNEMDQF